MSAPIKIQVPEGTTSMYLTALSLYKERSQIAVNWTDGSATFGATFVGPNSQYVLADKVFGQPIISLNDSIPKEISVSFKFHDTTHTATSPAAKDVGPQGIGTQIQITGYAAADKNQEKPTTITILFQRKLHGIKNQEVAASDEGGSHGSDSFLALTLPDHPKKASPETASLDSGTGL